MKFENTSDEECFKILLEKNIVDKRTIFTQEMIGENSLGYFTNCHFIDVRTVLMILEKENTEGTE